MVVSVLSIFIMSPANALCDGHEFVTLP
jgi:hypothetical protein